MAALVGAERLARADAAHALVRPGTPGGQSQTKWQAFTRQCGAGDLRPAFRPANSINVRPFGIDLLTPWIADQQVSAPAGKRQSNRAARALRRPNRGQPGSPDRASEHI